MSFGYLSNLNTNPNMCYHTSFKAHSKPVQNSDNLVEKFVQKVDEEKEKRHNKKAIAVGSSVLGLSVLVAVFNPKFSSKLVERLKTFRVKNIKKADSVNKESFSAKFHNGISKVTNKLINFVSWTNNFNSVKDTYYKKLCTEEKAFHNIHDIEKRKTFKKIDKFFRKIMQKPHEVITKWGDILAKQTVKRGYRSSLKQMDKFDILIKQYTKDLPTDKKRIVESKLREIQEKRKYFAEANLDKRFAEQEALMENLDTDIRHKWKNYTHGFVDKNVKNGEHFNQNLSFWAQDMMKFEREKLEKEGVSIVDNFVGNKDGFKGSYNEILDILSQNISAEEKKSLQKALDKTAKSLRNASRQEYGKYFDKKRDLVLGSAPTDILTAVIGLMIGGVSLLSADNKDDRISRLLTGIIPTIAGIGTNIVLTSMLFSGVEGMLIGVLAGGVMSLAGSRINKLRLVAKNIYEDGSITKKEEKLNV